MSNEIEKYMINNLEELAYSLADSIKNMSPKEMMETEWTLREEIMAIVRGCPSCSEMKSKKTKVNN